MTRCCRNACALVLIIVSCPSLSSAEEATALRLDPVVVTATRLPQRASELPAAVTVVSSDGLHGGRADIGIDEPLARVPGLFAQSSFNLAQDVRLQIRGFGARSGFGVREVKVMLDGLPLTFADGQSELDEVDVSALDHIEVVRGAAAAMYGNASGGVLQFFTPGADAAPEARARGVGGSYGLAKVHAAGSAAVGRVRGFLSASYLRLDGYRDHSAAQRLNLLGSTQVTLGADTDLRVVFTGLDTPDAQDPGALTAAESATDRRQARPGALRFDTGEDVLQGRVGTVLEHRTRRGDLRAYGFGVYRDVDSLLPIDPMFASPAQGGAVSVQRTGAGGGIEGYTSAAWLIPRHRLSGGVDVQYQRDARRRFANEDGTRGELGLDQIEEVRSAGPFLRYAALLTEQVEASIGVRYDYFDFDVDVAGGDEGHRPFEAWSPGGGVRYSPLEWLSLFGDVGTAFQVPTTTELANPAGAGFNPDVDPQTATSTEVGVRVMAAALDASVTGFVIDVRDVLVPYELESQPGRTFYRNASRARRGGVEVATQGALREDLLATLAFTYIDARLIGDEPDTSCCDGQREPGIPPIRLYSELAYRPQRGLGAAVELQWTADMYVDDANTAQSDDAMIGNVRLTYRYPWHGWTLLAGLGLNNIFNDRYDGRIRVNAQGGRYFEPAARFNVYGTIEIAWAGVG